MTYPVLIKNTVKLINTLALMKEMFSGFVTFGHFQSRKKAKPLLTTTSENRGNFH